jgi:2-dehydro-3-deoxy-D-arabinonate dehydratase
MFFQIFGKICRHSPGAEEILGPRTTTPSMKLCRFTQGTGAARLGLMADAATVLDLAPAGLTRLHPLLESPDPVARLREAARETLPRLPLAEVKLCAPVEQQEVWAAGVTYLRSKAARMEESDFSATAYDRVYAADRPEIFFKALAGKVAAPGDPVGIRRDARWSVPEPELALILNSRGGLVGCTIGNDMSSRDIEGENLLYLPQAKTYDRSCALGPCIVLGATEAEARGWEVRLEIIRTGRPAFVGTTSIGQIKRSFAELSGYLFRSQTFAQGAVLLTGTGIVPPDDFTLQPGDVVGIEISGIGRLENTVAVV